VPLGLGGFRGDEIGRTGRQQIGIHVLSSAP
jgi:hypothetical protein